MSDLSLTANQEKALTAVLLIVLAGAVAAGIRTYGAAKRAISDSTAAAAPSRPEAQAPGGAKLVPAAEPVSQLVVHVAGQVARPGVYRLPAGSRVTDALAAAGDALPAGAPDALNLAAPVHDGERVYVPTAEEAAAGVAEGAASGGMVRLNQATAAALEGVPGIGPALAERIVQFRQQNGPFGRVEDLARVPGIGDKTVERLKPYLQVP